MKKLEAKGNTVVVKQDDGEWRPVMFSRTTAMFTIPPRVRDAAGLVEHYCAGRGATVRWDEEARAIVITPGVERPRPAAPKIPK